MVSLGCPKALVDSERILPWLCAEGYGASSDYEGADAVIVNTCGFLDSAKAESLEAIGEALRENGKAALPERKARSPRHRLVTLCVVCGDRVAHCDGICRFQLGGIGTVP